MTIYDTIILGAGASGLYSTIFASQRGTVLLLEKTDAVGKKLSMTGNGKCNFTHRSVSASDYETDSPERLQAAFHQYGVDQTLQDFQRFGIFPVLRQEGYYPGSMDAKSVVRLLRNQLRTRKNVRLHTGEQVRDIQKKDSLFCIRTSKESYLGRRIIVCMGGKSYPKTGSNGDGYYYLQKLGHTIISPEPMLVPMLVQNYDKALFGIRQQGSFDLLIEGQRQNLNVPGELQFTRTGLSGIAVFQLSGRAGEALRNGKRVEVLCDFFPGSSEELEFLLKNIFENAPEELPLTEVLIGILQPGLMSYILKKLGLAECTRRNLQPDDLHRLWRMIKGTVFPISGTEGFDHAQTTRGGVPLSEICPDTMESEICPGLYFSGEIVNVNGLCGGYNLQWAWTSGYIAGNSGND